MIRSLCFLLIAGTMGCDGNKPTSAEKTDTPTSATKKASVTAEPMDRPKTKLQSSPSTLITTINSKANPQAKSTQKNDAKSIVSTLMETMIRRDIDGARALFPRAEFLNKHYPGDACQAFRDKVTDNREKLFAASRSWVRESIARILHPKEWKNKMTEMKDEIATSLDLRIKTIEPVSDEVTSLGDALSACKAASTHAGKRYRAVYDAAILGKRGNVKLDGEVMNLANQGWFVVGY